MCTYLGVRRCRGTVVATLDYEQVKKENREVPGTELLLSSLCRCGLEIVVCSYLLTGTAVCGGGGHGKWQIHDLHGLGFELKLNGCGYK